MKERSRQGLRRFQVEVWSYGNSYYIERIAELERARGEGASLRNLANAARVLEGNPALMNLRLIQSLTAAQNAGNTLVVGMPGGFVPLKSGRSGAHGSTKHEDGAS